MSMELELFNFDDQEIRVVVIDGEPWFVGLDLTNALGYADSPAALRKLDEADRANHPLRNSRGELRPHIVVNEPGMYQLVFGSTMSQAKQFKRWITHTVLPQLRKTGTFSLDPTLELVVQSTPNLVSRLYEAEFRNLARKIGMRESDLYLYIYKQLHPTGTYEALDKLAPKKWFPNSNRYRRVISGTTKQVMLYKFLTELGIEHNKYQQGKLSTIMQLVETKKQFEELCEKIFGTTLEITSK